MSRATPQEKYGFTHSINDHFFCTGIFFSRGYSTFLKHVQGLDIVLITIIVNNVWREFEAYLSFSGVFFTPKVSGLREEASHVLLGFLGGY